MELTGYFLVALLLIAAMALGIFLGRALGRRALPEVTTSQIAEPSPENPDAPDERTLLEAMPDPIFLLDQKRTVVFANKAAWSLVERAPEQVRLEAMLRQPELLAGVDEALLDHRPRDLEILQTGRSPRHLAVRLQPLTQSQDPRLLVLCRDVTATRRAERQRADFVANVSHELKTPLASLHGFIETLQGPAREDAAARAHFLEVMSDQSARMSRLIEDLLALSRIELAEHSPPASRLNLAMTLSAVLKTLEPMTRERKVTITQEIDALPAIMGDADELWRVFQNLLENAIKYGDKKVEVRAATAAADSPAAALLGRDGVAVTIHNDGPHIAPEHLPRLTERFYRVDTARSRRLGGTGLGLAIVKHIVNRHRGILRLDSAPGEGVTVTCLFPAVIEEDGKAQAVS